MRSDGVEPDSRSVASFRSGLYRYIRRRGFDRDEADDLTQETLLRAYQHLPGFRGAHLSAWVYRIAANLCIDHARKHRLHTVPLGEEVVSSQDTDPAEQVGRGEQLRAIGSLVGELPECHRRVITLRYFEDRSMADIASEVRCTPLAAKLRVFRAVTALRKAWVSGALEG